MSNSEEQWAEDELPIVEQFFLKIASVLRSFAEVHNLHIEKYPKNGPQWSFIFRHPLGGLGKVDVRMKDDTRINIYTLWWKDDYDRQARDSVGMDNGSIGLDPEPLRCALENALKQVLEWQVKDLDLGGRDGCDWRRYWKTKHDFDSLTDKYPIPK
ncbi:MAG: hypothetical protein A2Y07_11745 [Planctomycetes bacterium GWF2_50_10]|nr:MAG: hypothetical protein A2Y07_11745 [Planctomycetes bacterium GWF2_50_10]